METMCSEAYSKGFESLGFSSHAPITKKTGLKTHWHLPDEKLPEYIDTAVKVRKRWEGKLNVYLGLEVDYIEGISGPRDADIQELPLDYILGAVHYLVSPKDGRLFTVDGPPEDFNPGFEQFDKDGLALCKAYYDAYGSMVKAGGCEILGHLDIIRKNNNRVSFFSPEDPEYKKLLVKTADIIAAARSNAAEAKTPIMEVNTGSIIRGSAAEPYPSLDVLKLLYERNIPLVINSDAHAPSHLGGAYETAWKKMHDAGYTSVMLFEGTSKGKAVWREELISLDKTG
jgi:histidinol-phosphatase (PHP family)